MENENVYKLESIFEELGQPTLKAIAMVFDISPPRLYSVAKTPKEGEVYDAKVYNWDAVERFILRRLDPDKGFGSLEAVIEGALQIDKDLVNTDKRRRSEPGGSANVATIDVDGREMPVRKYDIFNMDYSTDLVHPSGKNVVMLRKDPNVYGFVYQTAGYTVLQPIGKDGEYTSETPKLMSNNLMNLYGLGKSWHTPEFIEKQYALQAAAAEVAEKASVNVDGDAI